jgi:DNA-binding winged helix-turn-helix (wHTH) protein/tetratricopeptide (TPR) repeat protein
MGKVTPLRVRFDAFELDEANARLTRDGTPVALPPKAFAVLCTLARQPGQLVTKNDLLDAVWGHQHVSESLLKNIISSVRAALADDAKAPRYIETASRFGYRFIGDTAGATPAVAVGASAESLPFALPASASRIIGREAALAKIRDVWAKALAGERQLLFVTGEAGVGKTTLIEKFVSELGPKKAAFGRCVEHFGSGEPYLPVLEVVREICRVEPELTRLMRTIAPTWLVQMPWLIGEADRAMLHREIAGAHPDRMLREMRELMDHFSVGRPFVFILEDMHWCDLGTLRMMEIFARRPRPVPILWIATFRLTQIIADNHPLRELRQELRLQRLFEEIALDPFSESDVESYLQQRVPRVQFSDSFIRRLHAHTDGLPLFVANVVDTLVTQESWLQDPSGDDALPVPDSLAGVIEKQIGRLPADVQQLLEAASVCGAEFRAGIVANMLERDAGSVRARCDDLVRRQIWLRQTGIFELPDGDFDSRYAFQHALYQHVLYHRLALSQRVQHHRRAARAIVGQRAVGEAPQPAELASHYERGHEFLAAMRAYSEAAGLALAHFAPKDTAFLSEHGLSLSKRCSESQERIELELALASHRGVASSQLHGVASNEAREAFAQVQALCARLPQTPSRAVTLNGLGWIYYVRGEFDEALALVDQLEDIAVRHPDVALSVLVCNLRGVALIGQGKLVDGCEWLERGIDQCRALPEGAARAEFIIDPEVSMRLNVAFPLVNRGLADRARTHVALGTERARRLGEPMSVMLSHWAGGMVAARLHEYEEVALQAASMAKLVETTMLPQARGPSLWLRGLAEAHLGGDPRAAHRRILEGYECHARLGMYGGCTEVLGYATQALILAGDWLGARTQVDDALALAARIGERVALPELLLLKARIDLNQGDLDAARASLAQALRESQTQGALAYEQQVLSALAELKRP